VVAADNAFLLPPEVQYGTGAALKSVYGTALYALRDRARLAPGEHVLVLGAAGGLGTAFLDITRILGGVPIAAVSTEEKASVLRAHGVKDVIVYTKEDLRKAVLKCTNGKGADVVADPVGGDLFDAAIRTVSWGARVCTLGFASGKIPQLAANYALIKSFDLVGVNYGAWVDRGSRSNNGRIPNS
jgi:NADPH:quinone reductase